MRNPNKAEWEPASPIYPYGAPAETVKCVSCGCMDTAKDAHGNMLFGWYWLGDGYHCPDCIPSWVPKGTAVM